MLGPLCEGEDIPGRSANGDPTLNKKGKQDVCARGCVERHAKAGPRRPTHCHLRSYRISHSLSLSLPYTHARSRARTRTRDRAAHVRTRSGEKTETREGPLRDLERTRGCVPFLLIRNAREKLIN
jgi:hypothetical protein